MRQASSVRCSPLWRCRLRPKRQELRQLFLQMDSEKTGTVTHSVSKSVLEKDFHISCHEVDKLFSQLGSDKADIESTKFLGTGNYGGDLFRIAKTCVGLVVVWLWFAPSPSWSVSPLFPSFPPLAAIFLTATSARHRQQRA